DLAIQQFRAVIDEDPTFPRAGMVIMAYVEKRRFADALAEIERWSSIEKRSFLDGLTASFYWGAYVYGRAGQQMEAQHALEQMEEVYRRRRLDPHLMVRAYIGVGRMNEAFAWLDRCYRERNSLLTTLKVDALFDPLRGDPRFGELLRRVGFEK